MCVWLSSELVHRGAGEEINGDPELDDAGRAG
jgi:hypothetical protein